MRARLFAGTLAIAACAHAARDADEPAADPEVHEPAADLDMAGDDGYCFPYAGDAGDASYCTRTEEDCEGELAAWRAEPDDVTRGGCAAHGIVCFAYEDGATVVEECADSAAACGKQQDARASGHPIARACGR